MFGGWVALGKHQRGFAKGAGIARFAPLHVNKAGEDGTNE